jgi:pimeloyl-ACP methyl ester carboxylesterase
LHDENLRYQLIGKAKMPDTTQRVRVLNRDGSATGRHGESSFGSPEHDALPPAIDAERNETNGRAGRVAYYVAGTGAPLLLIHSVNASASAFEMRSLFKRMRDSRRVYAVDLPGFGASARSKREYHVGLYVQAIHDMLDVIAVEHGSDPVDALALSLGAEFLARAATEAPRRFCSLALVNPTGFESKRRNDDAKTKSTREVPGLNAFLEVPLWGQAIFNLLVSRPSIRYFLRRSWGSKVIDEGLVGYGHLTAHRPGARHAPFAFVSGRLFSTDIRRVYQRLELPVWMPHGTRGAFRDFSLADCVRSRPNWTLEAFGTGAMPHIELAGDFAKRYAWFLASTRTPSRHAEASHAH